MLSTQLIPLDNAFTRNGHSKGIAFVEYEKEAEAAVALLKTDGTKLKGVELQV